MSGLDLEILVLSVGLIGLMKAALAGTLSHVHQRRQFGEPIAHNQLLHAKLAEMYTKYATSQAYL